MEATQKSLYGKRITGFLSDNAITVMIMVLVIFVGFTRENFISENNLTNLLINTSTRFIIACGVSGCLITKGTDLSAGRAVGMAACTAALLLQKVDFSDRILKNFPDFPVIGGLVITILVTGIFGILSGSVIAFLKVPPFITTLGVQTIIYGITLVVTNAKPMGGYKQSYLDVATTKFGAIPLLAIIALAVGVFMWFLYNKTRHGKYMYAIGGNETAASVAGVNVPATLIRIYFLAACLYGLAGFLVGARAGGASVQTGFGYELEAIAACTIGGVSTNGGVGRVPGILIGVLVFEILKISLQFLGVNPSYTFIVQGVVIIVAVALDLRKYLGKK